MPEDIVTLRQRCEKDPHNPLFCFSLAQALVRSGEHVEAAERLRTCCESRSDWMVPRIMLGKVWLELGHQDEARSILREALKLAIDQRHEEPEQEIRSLLQGLS